MLVPICVVEVIAGKIIAPVVQDPNKLSARDVLPDDFLKNKGQPEPGESCIQYLGEPVEGELTVHADIEFLPTFLEIPRQHPPKCRQADVDAIMGHQVLRPHRRRMVGEIGWGADHSHPHVGPYAYGNQDGSSNKALVICW